MKEERATTKILGFARPVVMMEMMCCGAGFVSISVFFSSDSYDEGTILCTINLSVSSSKIVVQTVCGTSHGTSVGGCCDQFSAIIHRVVQICSEGTVLPDYKMLITICLISTYHPFIFSFLVLSGRHQRPRWTAMSPPSLPSFGFILAISLGRDVSTQHRVEV
jgi:hypothetical protein